MSYAPRTRSFRPGERRSPVARPTLDPVAAWRALTAAVAELERFGDQPGRIAALADLRPGCVTAAYPVEGEAAKAVSNALLELARVYARTPDAQRGWVREALGQLGATAEALLDQHCNEKLARGRAAFGGE